MNLLLDTHIALWALEALPPHHQDPFDRLLIAQVQVEPMHLLSHDADIARYGELVIAV